MVLASAGCDFFAPSGPGGDGRRSAVSGLLGTPLPGTNPLASPSPTATPGGGGAGAGPVVKTQELTIVQGQVRAGLGGTNPLADATPLAALPEITDVPALPPVRLVDVAPLSDRSPLLGQAVGSGGALIGGSAAALTGEARAAYRVAVRHTAVIIEGVDAATGELVARVRAEPDGRYAFGFARGAIRRGLMVQATGISGGKVSSFLVAPVRVEPGSAALRADVTPASTLVALSAAVVTGVRKEFRVDRGFRGLASPELASLVAFTDSWAVARASAALGGTGALGEGRSPGDLLAAAASASFALAERAAERAGGASGSLLSLIAAQEAILEKVAEASPSAAAEPIAVISRGAADVKAEGVQQKAAAIAKDAATTPTSAELRTALPAPKATPGPSPEPSAAPSMSPGPSATPAPTPTPTPKPGPTATPASSVRSVSVAPPELTLNALPALGDPDPGYATTGRFTATVDADAPTSGVIWTSSDPTLVSVDASGNVAATRLASQSVVVIWESRQNAGDGPFDLTRAVGAGDTVDFCLTGGFAGGNTPLRVTITPGQ